MTAAEAVAAMRERHQQEADSYECAWCPERWPCDAAQLVAVAEAALALPEPADYRACCRFCGRALVNEDLQPDASRHADDCSWQALERALGGLGTADTDTPRSERETG